jgi:hypothetical protein
MRLAVLASLVVAASASAAAPRDGDNLELTGALRTSSEKVVDTSGGCGTGLRRRALIFASGAMQLGRGPAVARVAFELRRFRGPGTYSALTPRVDYGRTPLYVTTARNASTGAGSAWFLARRGTIRVVRVTALAPGVLSVAGNVRAVLADEAGRVVRLRGTWRCRYER